MADADHVRGMFAAVADAPGLLEAMFVDAPVAFALVVADGSCLAVNDAFVALFGSAPPAGYNVFRDELAQAIGLGPHFARALAGDKVVVPAFAYDARALRHVTAAGRPVVVELSIVPLRDREGGVRHLALSYKDVTAEHQLADERRVMRTLFEGAPEAIVIADLATGQILDANSGAARLFGWPREALITRSHLALSPPTQPDGRSSQAAIAAAVAAAQRGEPVTLEWTYLDAAGAPLPCEVRLSHVPAGDRVLCRVSILDLRERKRAEAERERVHQLEVQNARIREANRHLADFLAATAHDLRTPLNSIIGFAELLFDGQVPPGSPEYHEFTGDILAGGRHLLQLINDLLDLAKIEAGKLVFRPAPMDVEGAVAGGLKLLRAQAAPKRVELRLEETGARVGAVELDPVRFAQVLHNYVSNALKYSPDGGRVTVRVREEGADRFRLEVEDSGIGIAPDQLERLFLAFEQLEAGHRPPQGTGLGLALTRRLVEAQGGTVGVHSVPGRGSVFFAIFPRRHRVAAA